MTWWNRETLATGDKVTHNAHKEFGVGVIIRMRFNGAEVKWADGTTDVYSEVKLTRVKES